MNHSEPSVSAQSAKAPATNASASNAEIRRAAAGPSLTRALERGAVRDLQASRHDAYRSQDAQDRAAIECLRQERNETLEKLSEEANAVNTARELALGKQREAWIDARDVATHKKRAMNAALHAAREHDAPLEHARLEDLRHTYRTQLQKLADEEYALNVAHGLAEADLRSDWLDAQGRAAQAKRTMKAAVHELHRTQMADRQDRLASEDSARHARNEASDARWEAARKAAGEYGAAAAELRVAEQAAAPNQAAIAALRSQEAELRELAERLENEARTADLKASEELFETHRAAGARAGLAESQLREEWLAARYEANGKKRQASAAVRAFRAEARTDEEATRASIRARRKALSDQYAADVNAIYTARGLKEAELRRDYLDARAIEHAARKQAHDANRALAAERRAEERAELERIREQKTSTREAFSQTLFEMRKERGVERAEEREEARNVAREVFASYREAMAGTGGAQPAAPASGSC